MTAVGLKFCKLLKNSSTAYFRAERRGIKRYVQKVSRELVRRNEQYLEEMSEKERLELTKRSNFIEWNYSSEVYAFGKRLQEEFNSELLVQAFTHRSYIVKEELKLQELGVQQPKVNLKDNSELVAEGEKLISDFVPRYVCQFFPRFPLEGINNIHDYLTSDEKLAYISENLGTKFLILSGDYPVEQSTFAKTLKALVSALHESSGIKRANLFIRDFIVTQLAGVDINDFLKIENPLEVVNQILKRDGRDECEPRIICQSAVKTILANYHVGLYCQKELIGHCSGESVDIAIQMAALDALKRFFHTTDNCSPITYDVEHIPDCVNNLSLSEWNSAAFETEKKAKITSQ